MNIKQSYNKWADQYDTNKNRTRDLEAIALRETLNDVQFDNCLEIGCGTGKNTEWLMSKASHVTAVDFSEEMLRKAREKIDSENVIFRQADINGDWNFVESDHDLVSFSLVLEHIENLDHVFSSASSALKAGGYLYLGELHPFRQYGGTKARFDSDEGQTILTCFNHHVSDFIAPAKKYGLNIIDVKEFFDNDDREDVPRILSIQFRKNS